MKKFSHFLLALFFFCFGVVMPGCSQGKTGLAPEITAGTWINADGFKMSDHKNDIVVVEFWATWCPPCRKSIPHLKSLHHEYKDKGVVLVSLSNEPAATIHEFNKKAGMDWIVGADSDSGSAYGVSGIPTAFIVVDGKIAWSGHPMGGLDEELKKFVAARNVPAAEPVAEPVTESAVEPVPTQAPADIVPAGDEEEVVSDEVVLPTEDAATEEPAADEKPVVDEEPAADEKPVVDEKSAADKGSEKLGE